MRHSTVIKSVLASVVVLGAGVPVGHAQDLFFGMMPEKTAVAYLANTQHEVTKDQSREDFKALD